MSHLIGKAANLDEDAGVTELEATAPAGPRGLVTFLRVGFVTTLVLFLLGGFVLVAAQAVELVLGNGTAVADVGEKLGPPTFVTATVCGMFAFAQEYLRPGRDGEDG